MSNLLEVPIDSVLLPNCPVPIAVKQVIKVPPTDVYWCLTTYDKNTGKVSLFIDSNRYITEWSLEEYKEIYEKYKEFDITGVLKEVHTESKKDSPKDVKNCILIIQLLGLALRLIDREVSVSLAVIYNTPTPKAAGVFNPASMEDLFILGACLNAQIGTIIDVNLSIIRDTDMVDSYVNDIPYSNFMGGA